MLPLIVMAANVGLPVAASSVCGTTAAASVAELAAAVAELADAVAE